MRTCILLLVSLASLSSLAADEPKLIARPEAFKTLVNPNCSHCVDEAKRRAGELQDDERVLAWIRGYSNGGAIPLRFFLVPYRVISDTYGVFVYDFEGGYVRGFEPSLDFTFYGWRNGVMVIKHKDGTLYSALTGVAFDGPRKGHALKPVPTVETDWGFVMKTYPNKVAYNMYLDRYRPFDLPGVPNQDSLATRPAPDERLKQDDMVLGVEVGGAARAYPLSLLAEKKVIHDRLGEQEVAVLWHAPTKTAAVYARAMEKETVPARLTFNHSGQIATAPFMDRETYSHWDVTGRAVEGPLKGQALRWLPGVMCKWVAWAAEYPRTEIYAPPAKTEAEKREVIAKLIAGERVDWNKLIRSYARVISVTDEQVTVVTEKDKKEHTVLVTPQTEVHSHGAFGELSEFVPNQRVWVLLTTNEQKEAVSLHAMADEISMQLMSPRWVLKESLDGGKRFVFTDEQERKGAQTILLDGATRVTTRGQATPGKTAFYWNSRDESGARVALELFDENTIEARRRQQVARNQAEANRGLVATVVEVDEQTKRVALLVRRAEAWYARNVRPNDRVRVTTTGTDTTAPTEFTVDDVRPDYSRTRVKLQIPVACPMQFAPGQEVRVLMTMPKQIDLAAPPDLGRFTAKQDRIDWFLSSIYCTCGMMGDS